MIDQPTKVMVRQNSIKIPKHILEATGMKPGDNIVFETRDPGEVIIRKAQP